MRIEDTQMNSSTRRAMNSSPQRTTNKGRNTTDSRARRNGQSNSSSNRRDNNPNPNQHSNQNQRENINPNQRAKANQNQRTNQNPNQRPNPNQRTNPNQRANPNLNQRFNQNNPSGSKQNRNANGRQNQSPRGKNAQPKKNTRRLTPEEIAALKAKRQRKAELEKQRRLAQQAKLKAERAVKRKEAIAEFKKALVIFAFRAAVTVGCAAVFFAIFIAVFFMGLYSHGGSDSRSYTYRIGIAEDVYSETAMRSDKIYRNGAYYVELTAAARYLNLITTGDIGQIRFIMRDNGSDNVIMTRDSASVRINGMALNLTAPVIMENGEIWVPAELFERYVSGIEVNIDEDARIIELSRSLTADSSLSVENYRASNSDSDKTNDVDLEDVKIEYAGSRFNLHSAEPSERIAEYSLGVELLELTDPVAKLPSESSGELIGENTP